MKLAKFFALPILALTLCLFMAILVSAEETSNLGVGEPETVNDSIPLEELQDIEEAFPEATGDAGATPANPIAYGIDRALERISLALTFNKAAKAQKGLEHARERLLEVKAMILAKKVQQAERARQLYEEKLNEVKEAMENLEEDGQENKVVGTARNLIRLQNRIENHEMAIEALKEILSEQNLTESQREVLERVIEKIENKTQALKEKAEQRQEKIRERLRAVTGKNESEIEEIMKNLGSEEGLLQARKMKAERLIARTEESLVKLKARLNLAQQKSGEAEGNETEKVSEIERQKVVLTEPQISVVESYIKDIETKLVEAKAAYTEEDYEKVLEILKPVGNFGRQVSVAVRLKNLERIEKLKEQRIKTLERLEKVKEKLEQRREKILSRVQERVKNNIRTIEKEENKSEEQIVTGGNIVPRSQGRSR